MKTRHISDSFIDGVLSDSLKVGETSVGIKGYLDTIEATPLDQEVIDDPERIAGLYLATTDMIARNLRVAVSQTGSPEMHTTRRAEVKKAKDAFLTSLAEDAPEAADQIVNYCSGETRRFPVQATEYRGGFTVDGKDLLDNEGEGVADVRPNIKIQRQAAGTFVMAYSDERVREKISEKDEVLDKRIYLNPDMEATPELFEQLLQAANAAGIPMQLKMFQRSPEVAGIHRRAKNEGVRGDGIVVYAEDGQADDVLAIVLAIAKDNPDAFKGRKTSRIPIAVAEGIAVGDEPAQEPDTSLTSHRYMIFNAAAKKTRASGKQDQDARNYFRKLVERESVAHGVDPTNVAFNMVA